MAELQFIKINKSDSSLTFLLAQLEESMGGVDIFPGFLSVTQTRRLLATADDFVGQLRVRTLFGREKEFCLPLRREHAPLP